jgi:WASH complex subunit strumpellin
MEVTSTIDFLSENSVAGQTLLRLVSRGNAIIAELLRLSDNIPQVFYGRSKMAKKYAELLIDFSYFKKSEYFDNKIDSQPELFELDEEFRESHFDILKRFYLLFESIYKYISDYILYLNELEEGMFFFRPSLHYDL